MTTDSSAFDASEMSDMSDASDMSAQSEMSDASDAVPPQSVNTFHAWAERADAIRATSKRLEKLAVLSAYLPTLDDTDLVIAARFFSGITFPRHDARTTQVGRSIVYSAIAAITGRSDEELREGYVRWGDSGDYTEELFAGRPPSGVTLAQVEEWFANLAIAKGTNARRVLVHELLAPLGALEAKYFVKLLGGDLRIGLKEVQVEEALARGLSRPIDTVRRANLLRGDIGEVALMARHDTLGDASLALFHPLGFMLAQPLETAKEIVETLPKPFATEDKYDGIRAQAHISNGRVVIFSRTLDDITHGYPDVVAALATVADTVVLDGELLAIDPAHPERALPFKAFQRRLGKKNPNAALLQEIPATFVAYDCIAANNALVIDEPYTSRRHRLEQMRWPASGIGARLAPMSLVSTDEELDAAFVRARADGNEGIIAKQLDSVYAPGRRGQTWFKLKQPLASLDVVITGAERGHGKRRHVLSDYTFAVRASETDPTLLNVGKAYTGLTDVEIAALTERLHALTEERFGAFHRVRPEIVLEVTFDIVQKSARHKAGYALRFPRIVRIRDDKPASQVDTLARVRELAGDHDDSGAEPGVISSPDSTDAADGVADAQHVIDLQYPAPHVDDPS